MSRRPLTKEEMSRAVLESQLTTLGCKVFLFDKDSPFNDEVLFKHHPHVLSDFEDGVFDDGDDY